MINKAILMGRLTRDPEVRYSASGVAVARFTLAVDRRFVKQGEQRQADFINIVAFRQTAEFVGKYFVKGQLVAVVGSIQTRSWDGEDGQKLLCDQRLLRKKPILQKANGTAAIIAIITIITRILPQQIISSRQITIMMILFPLTMTTGCHFNLNERWYVFQ